MTPPAYLYALKHCKLQHNRQFPFGLVCLSCRPLTILLCSIALYGYDATEDEDFLLVIYMYLERLQQLAPSLTEQIRIHISTMDRSHKIFQFRQAIEEIKKLLEKHHSYRGLSLAQKIWQYNASIFGEIVEKLCSGVSLDDSVDNTIVSLDARELIKDCPHQKESTHPIEGAVLGNLIRDTQEVIDFTHKAYNIYTQNPEIVRSLGDRESLKEKIEVELNRLTTTGNLAFWCVERFLKPIFAMAEE